MSKFLIVCLGNIGSEYENTRHNIGFKVADELALAAETQFVQERLAYRCEIKVKGKTMVIIKPTTFMNLSGKALNYWMQAEKIKTENVLVITDDIALPFGTLRIKPKGSDGGHNGLKSIQETLNTDNYARLRFGVGNNFSKGRQVDYVLGHWNSEELSILEQRIKLAAEMAKAFCSIGLQLTMTNYNNK
jgi:PTH1 family peptidyl-tRNA hydrolase